MTDPLQVLGTTIAGKYDVVEFLFQRGARLAFRGLHRAWGEPVFVEFVALDRNMDAFALETQRRSLVRAVAGVARLGSRSTAVPQTRDGGTHPTTLGELPYAVTEWIEGAMVKVALDKARRSGRERFPPELVIDWFDATLDALALAHGDGIVHGHVGPETLMVTGGAFGSRGLVKLTGMVDAAWRKSLPGGALPAVFPPPAYAAPELGSADASLLGPWTDVYGLASVMVELIAGTTDRIALVTALPRELRHAFDKALATRIDERFKSITSFTAALEDGVRSTESARQRNPRRTMVVSEALPELGGSAGAFESADGGGAPLDPEVEKPRVRLALTQPAFVIPDALTQSDPSLPPMDPMVRSGDTMPAMPRPAPVRRDTSLAPLVLLLMIALTLAGVAAGYYLL
jgi:serine/threonine protein kinase